MPAGRSPARVRCSRSTWDCGLKAGTAHLSVPWPATTPTTGDGREPGSFRLCSRRARSRATVTWGSGSASRSDRWSGRRRRGRGSSVMSRRCGGGWSGRCRPGTPTVTSNSARADCVTSSSPSSCSSLSTAGPTRSCGRPRPCPHWTRSPAVAMSPAGTRPVWPTRTASCGVPSTACSCNGSAGYTPCPATLANCAGSPGLWVSPPPRRSWPSMPGSPGSCGGSTSGSSTSRCWRRWRGCPSRRFA